MVALSGAVMATGELEAAYGGAVVTGRPVGVFGQPNEYGLYCMLVVVFGAGLVFTTRGWVRWIAVLAAISSGVGLLLSLSRGSWLGAVAGFILLAVLIPQTRRPFLAGAALATVGGAVVALLPFQIPVVSVIVSRALTIANAGSNPYDQRPSFRAEGLREWQEKPIFGQGPNTFPELSTGINSVARPNGAEHPHNFFIAVGAEQGLIGILAVLGFTLAVVIAARTARVEVVMAHREGRAAPRGRPRTYPPLAAAVALSAAAVLGAFMVEGFADYPMRNALSRTTVWVMVGWALAGQRILDSARKARLAQLAGLPAAGVAEPSRAGPSPG
jgi:O-antigen ligase